MIVFFRRIPEGTIRQDLIDLLEPILKGKVFQKSGQIEDIKFLTLKDTQTNEIEVHALVSVNSDTAAKRVIKKLNKTAFKGKHIAVREYLHRSWHNDPRINMHEWNRELAENRKSDRRGHKRKQSSAGVAVKISSIKNFSRRI